MYNGNLFTTRGKQMSLHTARNNNSVNIKYISNLTEFLDEGISEVLLDWKHGKEVFKFLKEIGTEMNEDFEIAKLGMNEIYFVMYHGEQKKRNFRKLLKIALKARKINLFQYILMNLVPHKFYTPEELELIENSKKIRKLIKGFDFREKCFIIMWSDV